MRKLMTILATIVVVLALMAGGIWGYLWYSTQQQVEQIIAAAKPFAEISHGGVEISPSGSAGVRQIKIIPHFVNDVISIDAIRLNAPNILALLNIRRQLSQGQLPEALSLTIRGLELPLHGGIIGAKLPPPHQRLPFDDLEALGCGPVVHFSGSEWQEMGYDRFVSNVEIGYRLNANQMEMRLSSDTRDWATLNLDLGFALTAPATSVIELAKSFTPKLAGLNLALQDDGYNRRRNSYCAAKIGKPINEYVAEHMRLVVERLRTHGVYLGPGLIAAYQRYLSENGSVTLKAAPPTPINPAELRFYKAEDVIKLAGLTLQVDEQPVSDLSVDWNADQVTKALGIGVQQAPEIDDAAESVAPVAPKPMVIQKAFRPIAVSELHQHLGKIAKLKIRTGASYQGKLETFAEGMIRITIRKAGGTATLSLRSEEITQAQVLD